MGFASAKFRTGHDLPCCDTDPRPFAALRLIEQHNARAAKWGRRASRGGPTRADAYSVSQPTAIAKMPIAPWLTVAGRVMLATVFVLSTAMVCEKT